MSIVIEQIKKVRRQLRTFYHLNSKFKI